MEGGKKETKSPRWKRDEEPKRERERGVETERKREEDGEDPQERRTGANRGWKGRLRRERDKDRAEERNRGGRRVKARGKEREESIILIASLRDCRQHLPSVDRVVTLEDLTLIRRGASP